MNMKRRSGLRLFHAELFHDGVALKYQLHLHSMFICVWKADIFERIRSSYFCVSGEEHIFVM